MNTLIPKFFMLLMTLSFGSCKKNKKSKLGDDSEWSIPVSEVFDGGPGKDGIPSIDSPQFSKATSINFLANSDLILGIEVNGVIKGYPHPILDQHEIANDLINDEHVAITYCPLTGTGIGWDREINGENTTFGVSGLLYNSNLIPYDRKTQSNWSQMKLESVNGDVKGQQIKTHQLIETTWETWKTMFPNSLVMNTNTSFSRNYGRYPYGDYKTSSATLFPVSTSNDSYHQKARVLGVIVDNNVRVYPFPEIPDTTVVIQEEINGVKTVVVANSKTNFATVFESVKDNVSLTFTAVQNNLPIVMKDNEGNFWDIFGKATSGPRLGQRLNTNAFDAYIGYWFAWVAFYPHLTAHK